MHSFEQLNRSSAPSGRVDWFFGLCKKVVAWYRTKIERYVYVETSPSPR